MALIGFLCSVTGLNIEDPEAARKIIKTWDERHDMEVFCESGVDDQVSRVDACLLYRQTSIAVPNRFLRR